MTTPDVAKAPALFLRNATGLVKGWSAFDAFGYSFFSVNLVTLGMFYSLAIFAFVPDGSVLSALVLSGITMTFLCIVYAGLIAVMPRAGGDYVWQTRIFDGVPGAVVAASLPSVVSAVSVSACDGAPLGLSGNIVHPAPTIAIRRPIAGKRTTNRTALRMWLNPSS